MLYTNCFVRGDVPPYRGIFKYKDGEGRWHQTSRTLEAGNMRDAKRELAEVRAMLERRSGGRKPRTGMRPDISVVDYMRRYVDALETSMSVERTTVYGYRAIINYVDEGLCGVAMRDLVTEDVQAWEAELLGEERHLSPKTVRKAHVLLKTVCEEAIEDGLLDRNPVARVRAPKVARTMPNALPDDQRRTLLAYLEAAADTPFNLAVTIALMTGMRQGEICALRWGDVDFDARTVWVRRAIARDGGKTYVKEPKTASGRRDIPMAEALVEPLRRRYREMRTLRLEADLDDSRERMAQLYVLGDIRGDYASVFTVWKQWNALASSMGFIGTQGRVPSFHDLRHTFANLAIGNGEDVKTTSALLGHARDSMTLDVYADHLKSGKRTVADHMDEVLTGR
ncbi:MAG: tyrosine-type recombinase/integrase [Atopobiaceae bacterium]|jgi:integrase|nr:site-specific integrase [Atopobiaceae bacterium]MCH4181263.1 site-specific integrase [Atopobiaceae bacterium]MCH4214793.1 site-specific integrase [Atopobiaceae bacterium]MCH4276819.1 site-specific integrase [Atopobiaceae bacterium]MCI1226164.1 site-specific integrase [Atopobiaceae bacterium]